ncbi:MAG: hypothetical protein QOC95_465 [Thermoleophilaceae bacterium]|jgi:hypothetical protein|nr:hypothetical protein [Thermoleophilaceae bacterium]
MNDRPLPAIVAALVASIDGRSEPQTDFTVRGLVRGSWPGGTADRTLPAAAEWLRRWGPGNVERSYFEDCSCAAGRCAVCN